MDFLNKKTSSLVYHNVLLVLLYEDEYAAFQHWRHRALLKLRREKEKGGDGTRTTDSSFSKFFEHLNTPQSVDIRACSGAKGGYEA